MKQRRKLRLGAFPEVMNLMISGRATKPDSSCFQSLPCELLHYPTDLGGRVRSLSTHCWDWGRGAVGLSSSGMDGQRWLEEESVQRPTEAGVEPGESDFFTLICPFPSWPERLLVSFGLIPFPTHLIDHLVSFPRWLSGKESARKCRFDPWVG